MATLTREMMNQYSSAVAGGNTPPDLFVRDIPDFIPLVTRHDAPLAKAVKTGSEVTVLKSEWGEGDLTPTRVKTAAAVADATTLNITVDAPKAIQKYDVLYFTDNGEQVRVNTINDSTGVLTVFERGHGGSTAAAHNSQVEIIILGPAVPEGANTPDSPFQQGDLDYNYPQIFEYSWKYTHRGRVTPTYEIKSDRFKEELRRKMLEATRDLDLTMLYGLRNQGDGQGSNASTMNGVRAGTIQNRIDLAGAPLTLLSVLDLLEQIFKKVGQSEMAKTLYGDAFTKRLINSFLNASRRSTAMDAKLNLTLDVIQTDFGDIKYVTHYNWSPGEVHLLNINDFSRHAYKGGNWTSGLFSTEGWYDRGFLRGDFTLKMPAPSRRGALVGFSVDPTDYPDLDAILSNAS